LGTAFTSQYNFTNQLGLNPVFSFIQSLIDGRNPNYIHLNLVSDTDAIQTVQGFFKITPAKFNYSPVVRKVICGRETHSYNIVLVLMESMTSYNMKAFGNTKELTPVLDDLYFKSLSFRNFYSDGIHTFCGVYSSLYGFPSLPNRHHLKDTKNQQSYSGLAKTLESKNYETAFFISHDEQFDNLGGFLISNGFQKIFSQKDYSNDKILNTLGIPDHLLFEEAVHHIDEISINKNPFFVTILTSSNHGPYELPEHISLNPKSTDLHFQMIEYADWSIGEFLKSCRQKPWFDSTLFIFTGDHGAIIDDMDMYLTFHRVPLIIYAPKIISPHISESLGGQIDIYPTVMGLLNTSYINNSFGIDLLKEKRNLISFTYDDEFGVFSLNDFFVRRKGTDNLFLINPEAKYCKPVVNKSRKDSLYHFVSSILQTHQWIIENRRTGLGQ
jgi:phosphoglycerol transferase MdoB-like AlkP superfamily enzyme